jgi:lycopene beta-cyclase
MQTNEYDYIIAGAGCAGLSLAVQLIDSDLQFKKVLLIDKSPKKQNDRTWCFWTKNKDNWFDELIYKKWNHFVFKSDEINYKLTIAPYQYCLIRGIDFYVYCLEKIKKDKRFDFVCEEIKSIDGKQNIGLLKTLNNTYKAKYIFNSVFRNVHFKQGQNNFVQHFKGLLIEFEENVVDESMPVFMDFSVDQKNDCRFIYQIPFSGKQVLIEYTGFSPNVIDEEEYDEEIKKYLLKHYPNQAYKVKETEIGIIPMYESLFINPYGKNVVNIGTAGGASKASSGYTFYFIQKNVVELIAQLKNNTTNTINIDKPKRFQYYDQVLLEVMQRKEMMPKMVFETLFKKNKVSDILDFLNEESRLMQELKIINTFPKKYFFIPGIKKLVSK